MGGFFHNWMVSEERYRSIHFCDSTTYQSDKGFKYWKKCSICNHDFTNSIVRICNIFASLCFDALLKPLDSLCMRCTANTDAKLLLALVVVTTPLNLLLLRCTANTNTKFLLALVLLFSHFSWSLLPTPIQHQSVSKCHKSCTSTHLQKSQEVGASFQGGRIGWWHMTLHSQPDWGMTCWSNRLLGMQQETNGTLSQKQPWRDLMLPVSVQWTDVC